MTTDDRKLSAVSKPPTPDTSQTNGSHVVTLTQTIGSYGYPTELVEEQRSEYHLTARIQNTQLGQRELSLLLEVLEYQIVHFGINFQMMLALTELYLKLLGNKRAGHEINSGKVRTVVTVAEIILSIIGTSEFVLDAQEKVQLPDIIRSLLSPYLMDKRTYGSRYKTWRPEKYIRVRAVPVCTLIDRPQIRTERYSGYTKGYGESHGNAHRKKTKPSAELDGEQETADSEERNLTHRMLNPEHQPANSLWIKFNNLNGKKL
jgi:hypothetical protein